jgi:hypothetical protein
MNPLESLEGVFVGYAKRVQETGVEFQAKRYLFLGYTTRTYLANTRTNTASFPTVALAQNEVNIG